MNYSYRVLHQLLVVLLLHDLCEKILYLLLDLKYLLEKIKTLDETIQGPKRNLIDLQ